MMMKYINTDKLCKLLDLNSELTLRMNKSIKTAACTFWFHSLRDRKALAD